MISTSPACSAFDISCPVLRSFSFMSMPCLRKMPFSTPTKLGTWFMLLPTAALSTTGAWAPADHATTAMSVRATAGTAMRVMAPPGQALAGHRVHSRAVAHDEEANDADDD